MKNIITLLTFIITSVCMGQEVPDAFSYQAIAKDSSGEIVTSQTIGVQISLLMGGEKGNNIYTETHTTTTNKNGLFVLQIGRGSSSQKFSRINWAIAALWLKVSLDLEQDGDYVVAGSSQLLSVPYALYAKNSGNATNSLAKSSSSNHIVDNSDSFVASFTNTNGDKGDGIVIQLGRTHGAYNGQGIQKLPIPSNVLFGDALDTVKGWMSGKKVKPSDIKSLFPITSLAETTAYVSNEVIAQINKKIQNSPIQILPSVQVFPGYSQDIPNVNIANYTVKFPLGIGKKKVFPGYNLTMPNINIAAKSIGPYNLPQLPSIPAGNNSNFDIPNFSGFANVPNTLRNSNEFVAFRDKEGRKLGSIRAESMQEWRNRTIFDDVYLTDLAASFVGVDLLDGLASGFSEINKLVKNFNEMGVEYASGNGDYAEWLERENPNEHITAGDIVAVRGGKITKNLEGAEQIMAVSHKPIVMGNAPKEDKKYLGNTVAFMGQIPVKVLGAVKSGDYIVADTKVKGYGRPVSPNDMKAEDYVLAVGRSWDNHPVEGMKMVNTVIGVHNGDWVQVIQKMKLNQQATNQKIDVLESSIESIQEQLQMLHQDTSSK